MSTNRAPFASSSTIGNGPGQRRIHGIGTPASNESVVLAWAADFGCVETKRSVSDFIKSASRARSMPDISAQVCHS